MNIHGSTLSFPFRVDERGTLVTTSDPIVIAEQSLRDLLETRQGERVMLPNYGMPDRIFAVMGAGFTAQLAAELEEQIRNYLMGTVSPLFSWFEVKIGELIDGVFNEGFTHDQHTAAINIAYRLQGDNNERNLTFPTFQYRGEAS